MNKRTNLRYNFASKSKLITHITIILAINLIILYLNQKNKNYCMCFFACTSLFCNALIFSFSYIT